MNDGTDTRRSHEEHAEAESSWVVVYHPETREVRGADFHPKRIPDDGTILVLPYNGSLEWESSGWLYTDDGEFVDEPPKKTRE